jgi:hypothetical protein
VEKVLLPANSPLSLSQVLILVVLLSSFSKVKLILVNQLSSFSEVTLAVVDFPSSFS